MEEIKNIAEPMINEISKNKIVDIEEKRLEVKYNQKLTPMDYMVIESIRRLKNPFKMIGVNTVMKDLNICKTVAYRLFQREDFPSINIGKNNKVMLITYIIWKMNKRV